MRIVKLTKETTENILENMLKRSPTQYGTYEASVQEIIENVKTRKDAAVFEYTEKIRPHGTRCFYRRSNTGRD